MDASLLALAALTYGFGFASLGRWLALQKGGEPGEGIILGLLFGPLGCLIEALMPAPKPTPFEPHYPTAVNEDYEGW